MRLLRDLPEAEEKLTSGAITLTTASQLQNFFRAEKKLGTTYASAEKRELLAQIEDKSSRQTEGLLAATSPQAVPRERERALNETEISVTFVAPTRLTEKHARVRGLLAHRNASPTYAELFEILADIAIEKLVPSLRSLRAQSTHGTRRHKSKSGRIRKPNESSALEPASVSDRKIAAPHSANSDTHRISHASPRHSRYIPANLKRITWSRAGGRCEYLDRQGLRCASNFALEIDHKTPIGLGGNAVSENLQLLCRSHNAYKNLDDYGFMWRQTRSGSESG